MLKVLKKVVLSTSLLLGASWALADTLDMGTLPQGSVAYAVGAAIASTLGDQGMSTRVIPQGGPVVVLPLLNRESFDMTVTPSIPMAYGFKGTEMFIRAGGLKNIRALSVLFPLEVGFVVAAESEIKNIEDLKGKRVAGGFPRQQALAKMMEASLATGGLAMDDVNEVLVPNGVRGMEELAAGNVDAAIFSIGSGVVSQTHAAISGGVRFLPINATDEGVAAMQATAPTSYVSTAQPGPSRPGVEEPMPVLASSMILAAHASVDDERVIRTLETLVEHYPEIAEIHGAFRGFSPEKIYRDLGIPYHPAALAFFRSKGLIE